MHTIFLLLSLSHWTTKISPYGGNVLCLFSLKRLQQSLELPDSGYHFPCWWHKLMVLCCCREGDHIAVSKIIWWGIIKNQAVRFFRVNLSYLGILNLPPSSKISSNVDNSIDSSPEELGQWNGLCVILLIVSFDSISSPLFIPWTLFINEIISNVYYTGWTHFPRRALAYLLVSSLSYDVKNLFKMEVLLQFGFACLAVYWQPSSKTVYWFMDSDLILSVVRSCQST